MRQALLPASVYSLLQWPGKNTDPLEQNIKILLLQTKSFTLQGNLL